jgi:hypothetical protein
MSDPQNERVTPYDDLPEVNSYDEIPEFASEEEEVQFWSTHALGEGLLRTMERRSLSERLKERGQLPATGEARADKKRT